MKYEVWDIRCCGDRYDSQIQVNDCDISFLAAVSVFLQSVEYHKNGADMTNEREFLLASAKHRGIDKSGSVSKTLEKHDLAMCIRVELYVADNFEEEEANENAVPLLSWTGYYDYDTDTTEGTVDYDFDTVDERHLRDLSNQQRYHLVEEFSKL